MRKLAFVVPVVLLAAGGSTACATKKFVRGEVGEVGKKRGRGGRDGRAGNDGLFVYGGEKAALVAGCQEGLEGGLEFLGS